MAIHLKCEICLRLSKAYGIAIARQQASAPHGGTAEDPVAAVDRALATHQAITHPKASVSS
jgi:hypothetical protein